MEHRVVDSNCNDKNVCPRVIDDGDPESYLVQGPRVDDPEVRAQLGVPAHEGLQRMPRSLLDGLGQR